MSENHRRELLALIDELLSRNPPKPPKKSNIFMKVFQELIFFSSLTHTHSQDHSAVGSQFEHSARKRKEVVVVKYTLMIVSILNKFLE